MARFTVNTIALIRIAISSLKSSGTTSMWQGLTSVVPCAGLGNDGMAGSGIPVPAASSRVSRRTRPLH